VPVWRVKGESFPQIAQLEAFCDYFSTKKGLLQIFCFATAPFSQKGSLVQRRPGAAGFLM
jgi:hypothetical protein